MSLLPLPLLFFQILPLFSFNPLPSSLLFFILSLSLFSYSSHHEKNPLFDLKEILCRFEFFQSRHYLSLSCDSSIGSMVATSETSKKVSFYYWENHLRSLVSLLKDLSPMRICSGSRVSNRSSCKFASKFGLLFPIVLSISVN